MKNTHCVSQNNARRTISRLAVFGMLFGAAFSVREASGQTADTTDSVSTPRVLRESENIQAKRILTHVCKLCDPKLAGRKAGGSGAREAADYIAAQFRKIGLQPGGNAGSYFQTFEIDPGYRIVGELKHHDENEDTGEWRCGRDFMPVHLPGDAAAVSAECVLAGYGVTSSALNFDEYKGLDAKGKAVLVFAGVPWRGDAVGWMRRIEKKPVDTLAVKACNAAAHGARLMLVVDNPMPWLTPAVAPEGVVPAQSIVEETPASFRLPDRQFPLKCSIPVVHVSPGFAAKLCGMSVSELRTVAEEITCDQEPASKRLVGRKIEFKASIAGESRIGRNVIGVLPGSDPRLRNEAIVIGAHYDHLGTRSNGIYLGANDNAAGVGAMVEVANAFSSLPDKPLRTMIFIAFAAEEIGKLGSTHYVKCPSLPIKQTVMMINFDMIGRNEADQVIAVGTRCSPEIHRVHQQLSETVGLVVTNPQSLRLGKSDHSPFYYASVPIMYLFGGRHPGYHTPDDTVDKLVPIKIERVARLAFLTAEAISRLATRPSFQAMGGSLPGLGGK